MKKIAKPADIAAEQPLHSEIHVDGAATHGAEAWYENPESWVAISFLLFMVLAIKYIFPFIARGLDGRADKIRDQLEQANRLRAEAEQLLATYTQQQQNALAQAEAIIASAKQDAAALRARAAEELVAAIERRSMQAEEKIARAETDAIAQIRTQIIDKATEQARASVAESLASEKTDPAVARAIAAISSQIH